MKIHLASYLKVNSAKWQKDTAVYLAADHHDDRTDTICVMALIDR